MRRRTPQPRYPLLRIEWTDAESDDGWEDARAVRESSTRQVVSVGHLILETPTSLIIARSYGPNDDSTEGRLTIPKAWIQKRTRLS